MADEHVGHGPMGLIAPGWYLAPQRREVAEAGWTTGATLLGALGDGPVFGLDDPQAGPMLLWLAGEFAAPEVKDKIWAAADERCGPTWDESAGEFTLSFGLDEPHPRGQLNARSMAGWVCRPGDWSAIFNEPNLAKFDEPTVTDVDFPRIAMSEARWDGTILHLAAHPQNGEVRGTTTTVTVNQLPSDGRWRLTRQAKASVVDIAGGAARIELIADDEVVSLQPE